MSGLDVMLGAWVAVSLASMYFVATFQRRPIPPEILWARDVYAQLPPVDFGVDLATGPDRTEIVLMEKKDLWQTPGRRAGWRAMMRAKTEIMRAQMEALRTNERDQPGEG